MLFQQGDVLIETFDEKLVRTTEVKDHILAHGEATGHYHKIFGEGVSLWNTSDSDSDVMVLDCPENAILEHQEHKPVNIPGSKKPYRVRKVREYDHVAEESRAVQD